MFEEYIHKSGLKVYFNEVNSTDEFIFNMYVKIGGTTRKFKKDGKDLKIKSGLAHFLEHTMFHMKYTNTFDEFYKYQGEANAYTGLASTNYYVSGIKNPKENLKVLLNYLSTPYFTSENVEKERGIILEEYRGNNKVPDVLIINHIVDNLFKDKYFENLVIGKEKDIKTIYKNDLEDAYNHFYNTSNMFLIVSGKFEKDEIIEVLDEFSFNNSVISHEEHVDNFKIKKEDSLKLNVTEERVVLNYKFHNLSEIDKLNFRALIYAKTGAISKFSDDFRKKDFGSGYEVSTLKFDNTEVMLVLLKGTDTYRFEIFDYLNEEVTHKEIDLYLKKLKRFSIDMLDNASSINDYIIESFSEFDRLITLDEIEKLINLDNMRKLQEKIQKRDEYILYVNKET